MNEKLDVLIQIAQKLNEKQIPWRLGGSGMLYLRGLMDHFDDIDITIKAADFETVMNLFKTAEKLKKTANHQFKTKHFQTLVIDTVSVDIMADLVIVHRGNDFSFAFEDVAYDKQPLANTTIYLASLETWLDFYKLMERYDKVALISAFLSTKENR